MKSAHTYKHCSNCGQEVTGLTARAAKNPATKFCSECGVELSSDGKCQNSDDKKNFGKVPPND